MGKVVDVLTDWALEVLKEYSKNWKDARELQSRLKEYFAHCEEVNEISSLSEECDFEGLCKMLIEDLSNELKNYVYGTLEKRNKAKETILNRALEYDIHQSGRAKSFVQGVLNIIDIFFRDRLDKDIRLACNMILESLEKLFMSLQNQGSCPTPSLAAGRPLMEVLTEALNRMSAQADHYSLPLDPIEKSLWPDIIEDSRNFTYHSTEEQTALMQKLEEMEDALEKRKPVLPFLMTGEGGIGKTITMLQTAWQLLKAGKNVVYVPLRRMRAQMSLEQFVLSQILQNDRVLFEKIWNPIASQSGETVTYFLLDGFNEVQKNLKSGVLSEIRDLASRGCMVVVSSRRTFEEENCMDSHYQRLCMQRLSWDTAVEYLDKQGIQIPDENKMSEILGIPLMLIIYVKVRAMEKQNILGDFCCSWRSDLSSPGNLLWDYIQCQIFAAKKMMREKKQEEQSQYCSMDFIVAAEFIAPYLASKMNGLGLYTEEPGQVRQWIEEGLRLLEGCMAYQKRRDNIQVIEEDEQVYHLPSAVKILQLLKGYMNLLYIDDASQLAFAHQEFQDILHYIYIEESFRAYGDAFYAGAFSDARLPYDVITRISDMMPLEKIKQIWDAFRGGNDKTETVIQPGKYGIANLVEVFKRNYKNNLSGMDFSGLDLRRTVLTGTILAESDRKACFRKADIGDETFAAKGHSAPVSSVAFSHTGGKFVSASYDKTLKIWNTSLEEEPLPPLDGHRHYVRCAAWSPDDSTIISGGDDRELFVWDVPTWINRSGEKKKWSLTAHEGWIYSVAWSASGEYFSSGDSQGILCIWKYNYGNEPVLIKKILQAHRGSIQCIAWSAARKEMFVSGSADGQLKLWIYQEEKSCKEFDDGIDALAFSPDGQMLVVGAGKEISVWKIVKQDSDFYLQRIDEWKISGDAISGIVWTRDFIAYGMGREIRILSSEHNWKITDNEQYLWNPSESYETASVTGHKSLIKCIAWSEQEKTLLTGSDDSSIRIWKARNPMWNKDWNCIRVIEGASLPVRCVAWSEDSKNVVAGYDDNVLRLWNIEEEICYQVLRGHENRIKCVDWKGPYLASGSNDKSLRIWKNAGYGMAGEADRQKNTSLCVKNCGGAVNCVKWFSNQHRVISGSDDGILLIWNWETGEEQYLRGHENRVYGADLSPDEDIAASGSNDRTIRFWNTHTGKEIEDMRIVPEKDRGHQEPIRAVAWSQTREIPCLFSASNDKTLICWEEENGIWKEQRQMTGHEDFVYCLSWQPEGKYIVSGSTDNTLWIWEVESGKPLFHLTEHTNYAHGVAWSPDGKYIASASCDGKIIIWDVQNLPEKAPAPIHTFEAMSAVELIGCDFTGARFETELLKKRLKMNGGIVDKI